MKLRNFLYLNTNIVEEYISAIEGYTYDEESQAITSSSENSVNAGLGLKAVSAGGAHNGKQSEEIKRSVKISDAAKFDKIYTYLQSGDEEEKLKYYEFLSEDIYNALRRDDFIEVLVTARFSKTKELIDGVKKISDLVTQVQGITDQKFLGKKESEAINGFSALGKMKSGKEISCVFNFDDRKYPLVAYLDENYFRCEQDNFIGQSYMLCKIIRKIPKGQHVKIDEIFDDIKKLPLNHDQRRKILKNMDNPDIIKDIVKGPAMIVVPVAVYQ